MKSVHQSCRIKKKNNSKEIQYLVISIWPIQWTEHINRQITKKVQATHFTSFCCDFVSELGANNSFFKELFFKIFSATIQLKNATGFAYYVNAN